jgi:putative tricarboxylic transport membrane protein
MTEPAVARRADLLGGAAWMAFGLAILVGAWRMDRFESMGATLYTAPGLVPGAYGLILLALGAVLAWRNRRPGAAAATEPLLNRRIVLMALLTLTYALLGVGRLPFGPVTAVFVAAFCWTFDDRPAGLPRATTAVLVGVATAVVVVLVFERVFLVRLP